MNIRKFLLENEGNLKDVEMEELEKVLPEVYEVEEDLINELGKRRILDLCLHILKSADSSRTGRRYALAFLKIFFPYNFLQDFHVLVEALEEPQFHIIQPVLPRMISLIKTVEAEVIEFSFVQIVIFRGICHTNGWIRTWAIRTAVNLDSKLLSKDIEYIPNVVLHNLNNNDIFWRFLEKSEMELFTETLSQKIAQVQGDRYKFFEAFLTKVVDEISCPTALYFASTILEEVQRSEIFDFDDIQLFKRVIWKSKYIPHKSLRIITIRQFILFFVKVTKLSSKFLHEISQLIALISCEAKKELIEDIYSEITKIVEEDGFLTGEDEDEKSFLEDLCSTNHKLEAVKLWWISMRNDIPKQEKMVARLQLILADQLEDIPQNIENVLFCLYNYPPTVIVSSLERLKNLIGAYIVKRAIGPISTDFECYEKCFNLFFLEYNCYLLDHVIMMMFEVLKNEPILESHVMVLAFLDEILEYVKNKESSTPQVIEYLNLEVELLGLKRQNRSNNDMSMKEFNHLVAKLHSTKLKLFLRYYEVENVEKILLDCIEQLDIASAFSVKQKLCEIMAKYISKTSDEKLSLSCIRAALNIVNEEKKSLNSLPALEAFVNVALESNGNQQEIIAMFEDQMLIANQSTQVALVISNGICSRFDKLQYDWAAFIVKLCIFGPVPKKDTKVISFCYEKIFSLDTNSLENDKIERLDQVVQIARFQAIEMSIKLAEKDEKWAIKLAENVIIMSKLMDQSSSRSFGLSLAHRQKTRAVELVLLVTQFIKDQSFISELFDYLVSCIIDPCQQFSIKLIVEWTIVNIAIAFETEFFEKLVSPEFEKYLAESRIGSISSWINILTLISRTNPKLQARCLEKVVSWTSAQNFPVRCTAIAACRLMYFSMKDQEKYGIIRSIVEFSAEPSGNSKRVIENLCADFYFAKLHTINHFDLQTILVIIAEKTGMPPEETIPVEIIKLYNNTNILSENTDGKFLSAPSDVYSALMKNATSAPSMKAENENEENDRGEFELVQQENTEEPASFQRKIVKEKEEKDPEKSLIVVATLVDKPTNLGGICRTCEIFGVDSLVISDVLLAGDSNFRALSMSSENWQKIEAVKPQNLLEYLQKLRTDGYTVIAVEQTTDSVMMHDFVFPKKSVIVMGDEKEGVPVHLLRAVDKTVEIKQLGHTRSLNVHVTAALMISKFAEQVLYS